jgi:hypothetical protein
MNLLNSNATGAITGPWIGNPFKKCVFYIEGTPGGATYTLRWRPSDSTGNGNPVVVYDSFSVDTTTIKTVEVSGGWFQVEVSGGSGINAMPQIHRTVT